MQSFTDTAGRSWSLDLNVAKVKAVKESTGVLLTGLFDEDMKPFTALLADVCKLVDVLWCLVRSQRPDVTDEQFAESMGGQSLGDATTALGRAVADFFPNQAQRVALSELLTKAEQTTDIAIGMAAEKIRSLDPSLMAKGYMASVSSGPELSEETPGTIPLANSA